MTARPIRWPGPRALAELERLREHIPDAVNSLEISHQAGHFATVTLKLHVTAEVARILSSALAADLTEGNGGNKGE